VIQPTAALRVSLAIGCAVALCGPALTQPTPGQAINHAARLSIVAVPQPDTLRDALTKTFAAIARSTKAGEQKAQLIHAHQLADAYSVAWKDSFFVRQLREFEGRPPRDRVERVIADSIRIAGITALGRDGVPSAMKLWRESLRRADRIDDRGAMAPALVAIGGGFYRAHYLDSATAYLNRGKDLARRIGDRRTIGNALGVLASIKKDHGETTEALRLYGEASAMRARSGDTRGIAADQNNIGLIARARGDVPAAVGAFEQALAINRRDGRQNLVALNLGNLAGIASDVSDYARADSLFRLALNIQHASGDHAATASMLQERGRLQIRRGDYAQASATLSEALRIHEQSGATADAISVRSDLAALQSATGRPDEALRTLEQAERDAAAANSSADIRGALAIARGDLGLTFGTFSQAEADFVRAERIYGDARNEAGRSEARYGRALIAYRKGDNTAAANLIKQSREAQLAAGDRRAAALTQLLMASVQQSGGNNASARSTLVDAQRQLHFVGDAAGEAAALELLGNLALKDGSPRTAKELYRRGLIRLGERQAIDVRWRLHAGIAQSLRELGDLDESAREFHLAIAVAEKTANRIRLEERRYGFLTDKWSTYTQLSQLEQARGHTAEAFSVSERLRARQLVDMLAHGRVATRQVRARQEQDYRRRVAELTDRLENDRSSTALREPAAPTRDFRAARAELAAAQNEYAQLMSQMREREPGYERLLSAATVSPREVSLHLKPDEVMLEYLLGDSACTVFVITTNSVAAIALPVTHAALADAIDFSRRAMERSGGADTNALWRPPLQRLYRELILPVEQKGQLRGKRRIVIVPHAELHFLSFAALMSQSSRNQFLIDRFEIAYAPSATAWVQLAERKQQPMGRNVLALAPRVAQLRASQREMDAIGRIYGARADVRVGAKASERGLREGLAGAGTIHLATFGVLNKRNPLFSFVELAPSPGDDGRLEVNEVFDLGLSGQLVVLSACQTAMAAGANDEVPPGDDWIGLVQAFLQGGASRVMASLWPVEDRTTALLMERFHRRLAEGRPPVSALAESQREMLHDPQTLPPFFWAAFVITD
jgi:CHAT domain-containing protein/tetratricopeptide (TPR) repeat protein